MQERNRLWHLLSPDGKVRNPLDLSQKVVSEDSEPYTTPADAAAAVGLRFPETHHAYWAM